MNGAKAIRIDYKTTGNGKLYLKKDIAVPGIPETLLLDFRGDGGKHRLYIVCEDVNGDEYTLYRSGYVDNAEQYETMYLDASAMDAAYPVTVREIYLRLESGEREGSLFVDDLRMTYPGNTGLPA
ncbi:MAG: hypothetical protein U5N26_06560 [Candidatus Marinimicrobia bacterium]|nr:hypothetical protein [Candidatus Neomarinimicrobiota bacterium]